uniref:UPF0669 protein C6orf120 homolog n=1 Tax=Syphacia muris TaxID=451379 RepID=A0A0N5AI43_9BILA
MAKVSSKSVEFLSTCISQLVSSVWIQTMLIVLWLVVVATASSSSALDGKYDLGKIVESNGDGFVFGYMFLGEVEAGNFSYFELKTEGRLRLILQSISGDADIYLSFSKKYPGTDVLEHDMVSASCGIDYVDIPLFSRRPVHVGVIKRSNDTEFEPEIYFQPEEIKTFMEFNNSDERQSESEISSITNYFLLLLKVILEAVVEIAL